MWTVRRACEAISRSWVTMTIVLPAATSSSKRRITASAVAESRLPVGSSATRIGGSLARARAIATRCCWPPDVADGSLRAWSTISTCSRRAIARSSRSRGVHRPPKSIGSMTFSTTVRVGSSWKNWKITPTVRPRQTAVSPSERWLRCVPPTQTSPAVARSMPVIMFMSVDLPDPDLPTTARNSPLVDLEVDAPQRAERPGVRDVVLDHGAQVDEVAARGSLDGHAAGRGPAGEAA